jgi:uncharacterized protein
MKFKILISAKSILLVSLLFSVISVKQSFAQNEGDAITIGKYQKIHSTIMNEDRTLLIHLPRSYAKTKYSYPVFYLLYGNHTTTYFAEAVSILDGLGTNGRIPEMILVGITNTDRYRDLLPLKPDGTPTGIDNFVRFFGEELFPFIDKNYRAKNYKVIIGPQAGANFGFHVLFTKPDLFDAFILNNPFRWTGGRDLMFQQAQSLFEKNKSLKKFLFITYEDSDELAREGIKYIEQFQKLVDKTNPNQFQLGLNFIEGNDEFISPLGLRKGIKTLFQNYPFPENVKVNTLNDILTHYKKLSDEYGFEVDVPDLVLSQQSDKLSQVQKINQALEIWQYMLEKYPNSGNALWRLANYHQNEGDLIKAKGYYGKMLDSMGSDVGMIKNMFDLVNKMINESAAYALDQEIKNLGLDAAKSKYSEIKTIKDKLYFNENELNTIGYRFMQKEKLNEAIFIFSINVEQFPKSANAYDSLGEAYMNIGQTKLAIQNYEKSLKLNPESSNAKETLKKIKQD